MGVTMKGGYPGLTSRSAQDGISGPATWEEALEAAARGFRGDR